MVPERTIPLDPENMLYHEDERYSLEKKQEATPYVGFHPSENGLYFDA